MGHPVEALFLAQTAVLVALSLWVVYSTVAYARNVMHTEACYLLAASLVIFTASAVVEYVFGLHAVAEAVHAASDLTFAGAVWLFAREFVRTGREGDPESASVRADEGERRSGGFESARRDG